MGLLSSNIIERHTALADLLSNPLNYYTVSVVALLVVCWFLKEWI